jgi:hypothetical protein
MVEIITLQTIMINNAQNNFFFMDKGKEMRLQIHGLIEKKKKQTFIINRYRMKNELTLICRRHILCQCFLAFYKTNWIKIVLQRHLRQFPFLVPVVSY